jgi:exodeoxyribonuclease-3
MKLCSWNVNGLRAVIRKGKFAVAVHTLAPDVLCLQETKINSPMATPVDDLYPFRYFNAHTRPGYCGVAVFSKQQPISVSDTGMGEAGRGRYQEVEFADFLLINVYTPNSGVGDSRTGRPSLQALPHRMAWDKAFRERVQVLTRKKPVIIMGDLNVAPVSKDQAASGAGLDYFSNNKPGSAGLTPQEIAGFHALIATGFVDTFRALYPNKTKYTYQNFRAKKKPTDTDPGSGWRIDMTLVSRPLMPRVADSDVHDRIEGSDHRPISLVLH